MRTLAVDYLLLSTPRSGSPSETIYMIFVVDLSSCAVLAWCVKNDVRTEFVLGVLESALASPAGHRPGAGPPPQAAFRCTRRLQDTGAARAVALAGDLELERAVHAHRSEYRAFLRAQQDVLYTVDGVAAKTWAWSWQHNDSLARGAT
ncbi:hypothetical protein AB0H73_00585 [Streptomyces olivoreticuli]